jgi:membrane-associated phospholipid phosphatase
VGDVLQYAFPIVVGALDLWPDVVRGEYRRSLYNAGYILALIGLQNRVTVILKQMFKKPRPSFPDDLESFPSGHMMIAAQCLTRVFFAYTSWPLRAGAIATTACIGLGRYLPGKHDLVDLAAGGALGVMLGSVWNRWVIVGDS